MVSISTKELYTVLENTPADQNIMLAGRHGIGKSQILSKYFRDKGFRVIEFFLGQMSDPGDLIGLPTKNEKTGHTEFMPPYWFPTDNEPVVLFLDEMNRARPEVLQTVMDLCLNRKLAGKGLPAGSRVISAVNDGEEYQITDLDPALISRFNVYNFKPSVQEWLLWADKEECDKRVIDFIQEQGMWLDGNMGESIKTDTGLEKSPDRRAWKKVSDIIKDKEFEGNEDFRKLISGVIGVKATAAFYSFLASNQTVTSEDILLNFTKVKKKLKGYKIHQLSQINEGIFRYMENHELTGKIKDKAYKNLSDYIKMLSDEGNKEAMAHFVSMIENQTFPKAISVIVIDMPDVYMECTKFIGTL